MQICSWLCRLWRCVYFSANITQNYKNLYINCRWKSYSKSTHLGVFYGFTVHLKTWRPSHVVVIFLFFFWTKTKHNVQHLVIRAWFLQKRTEPLDLVLHTVCVRFSESPDIWLCYKWYVWVRQIVSERKNIFLGVKKQTYLTISTVFGWYWIAFSF